MLSVYRFLDTDYYRAELLSGRVRISTLEACRGYENPKRGDKGEGSWTYFSGHVQGDGDDPALQYVAQRSSISVDRSCRDITISECQSYTRIPDAFVLCWTLYSGDGFADGELGGYGVKLSSPRKLMNLIGHELNQRFKLRNAMMGAVSYRRRVQYSLEEDPCHIAFVKEPDGYADQVEFRMLWVPELLTNLKPVVVNVGDISDITRKI
ncbi:hypothetical protein [Halomonas elongata]|uniref:Uncharacterized protein n=1 Tax=Halomonas elongata (strain ATCC 33173 / DSM 2581 / NBRC 15536 / NCIMB 2198 / 1H9) TaxID=768066 RepID=A0ABZ0TBR3_HALED|nr:hypothetical protein [Halomonas elongata]WBF19837.1 hypothetical protein LM502_09165 [Halomonas elongata]WPU48707.1 hypothetical protein SR933_07395 [Halomonas elongata DSM 2581]